MRFALVAPLLAATTALAQNSINGTKLTELSTALSQLGLNTLAGYAATIANSSAGIQLLTTLTNTTGNYTIFAPTDSALNDADKSVVSDPDQLATIISYHVVRGTYLNASYFFDSPNNTILSTLLNDTDSVRLQGNQSQVLVATVKDGNITIANQSGDISASNSTQIDNFTILKINGILSPPGSLSSVLKNAKLTLFTQALQQAGLQDTVATAAGITIFAPTDEAFQAALSSLGDQAQNKTLIQTVLQNHIINGTSIYSTQFDGHDYTSAAGEGLHFNVTNSTISVSSGDDNSNITARVTTRDLLAVNGVVHIIDGVLANTARDDDAANSAYSSATSAASSTESQTPTGPVGGAPTDSPGAAVRSAGPAWAVAIGCATLALALGLVSV